MDLIFVETAGGVNSPTMSGSLQCDAFRPLRLPSILIGDSKLGGISTTLSAYESLRIRGYDISHVLLFDDPDRCNHTVIERNVRSDRVIVHVIPLPPPRPLLPDGGATTLSKDEDMANMSQYICSPGKGTTNQVMRQVVSELRSGHETRLHRLEQLKDHGANKVWWPFTQHQNVKHTTVIDSAYGDCFTVYNSGGTPTSTATSSVAATAAATAPTSTSFLKDQVDACASWWTNGEMRSGLLLLLLHPIDTFRTQLTRPWPWKCPSFKGCSLCCGSIRACDVSRMYP